MWALYCVQCAVYVLYNHCGYDVSNTCLTTASLLEKFLLSIVACRHSIHWCSKISVLWVPWDQIIMILRCPADFPGQST